MDFTESTEENSKTGTRNDNNREKQVETGGEEDAREISGAQSSNGSDEKITCQHAGGGTDQGNERELQSQGNTDLVDSSADGC